MSAIFWRRCWRRSRRCWHFIIAAKFHGKCTQLWATDRLLRCLLAGLGVSWSCELCASIFKCTWSCPALALALWRYISSGSDGSGSSCISCLPRCQLSLNKHSNAPANGSGRQLHLATFSAEVNANTSYTHTHTGTHTGTRTHTHLHWVYSHHHCRQLRNVNSVDSTHLSESRESSRDVLLISSLMLIPISIPANPTASPFPCSGA